MILLDTHVWVWWVDGSPQMKPALREHVEANESTGLGVSVISCWEVAKLVELNRLELRCPVAEWIQQALAYPGIRLLYLTPRIAVESTQLPGTCSSLATSAMLARTELDLVSIGSSDSGKQCVHGGPVL